MEIAHTLTQLLFLLYLASSLVLVYSGSERKSYIVYMGDMPEASTSVADHHHSLLLSTIRDESIAKESKIHSYGKSFNGFVANLLPHEVEKLLEEDSVVSVFENTKNNKLHTTRSWDFLGMTQTVKRIARMESNIIVGVLDSGIDVDSPSFSDKGFGPAPARWKGKCVTGGNFTACNNKVIGAKYYNLHNIDFGSDGEQSAADYSGHGTHTSSILAGNSVQGASLYGIAKGTARGGVPSARIAMYKVSWGEEGGSTDMDILAAFDDAIANGVDIISVSIGGERIRNYFEDPIAIGSFHAMKRGILTSCSAGNWGPEPSTVINVAPWILTVAASTIDRKFKTPFKLGNGMKAEGVSINTFSPRKKMYPLTNGAHATNVTMGFYGNISACASGTLGKDKVQGKIVYCLLREGYHPDYTVKELKGAGIIMSIDKQEGGTYKSLVAATIVNVKKGHDIDLYINTTKNPQAMIYKTRTVKARAPALATFSGRGPQVLNLNILKPDLVAPGVDILAASSKLTSVTGETIDNRHAPFNIMTGTSMACPHASAAAVYVKTFHPDWSPAAIKSALMSTATPLTIRDKDTDLSSGSGQINPRSAVHPGLIYDISMSSYLSFLCKEGYNSTTIGILIGGKRRYNCTNFRPAQGTDGLNYPSMHKQLESVNSSISAVFYRTVTNVAYGSSVYKAIVTAEKGLSVKVVPETLTFTKRHQKQNFMVIVKGGVMRNGIQTLSALLEWNDTRHSVRSPIVIYRPSS
ncbi:hypothetical protein JCGZ_21014 [Jatropha curcas]|uniref:Uncharacterized protein n=1 Tax=Jatropha curcas TaxID=180498 RepID=A0A067JWY0_JATCU|nr:hypothetical protein JCGZ_21014 [Jatropha curcas]